MDLFRVAAAGLDITPFSVIYYAPRMRHEIDIISERSNHLMNSEPRAPFLLYSTNRTKYQILNMSLQDQMKKRLIAAMKEGKKDLVIMLRGLQALIKNKQIDLQRELEDSEIIDELKTASKQLKDAMAEFVKAERADLIEKTKVEIDLISEFLPAPMERVEIRKHVVRLAADVGATTMKDMGKLMGAVMKAAGAAANGEDVRAEVETFLNQDN
jgi:uncharacterized protein